MSSECIKTGNLGCSIARLKSTDKGTPISLELFTPPDSGEHGVIQAQYIYLNGAGVSALKELLS